MFELRFGINQNRAPFHARKISKIIVHPAFVSSETGQDIALIKMDHQIHFQYNLMPICLPQADQNLTGENKSR